MGDQLFLLIKQNTPEDANRADLLEGEAKHTQSGTQERTRRTRVVLSAVVILGMTVSVTPVRAAFLSFFERDDVSVHNEIRIHDTFDSQTVTLLQAARHIDPNPSRGGAEIYSDDGALVYESTPFNQGAIDQVAPPTSDQISLYVVQEGDTLSQVAQMFSVSVNTIVWANELSSNKDIHPGQTLLILPINGIQHTVEKGDTLARIAETYHGDEEEIIAYNGLVDGKLVVGDVITIPGGEIEEKHVAASTVTPTRSVATGVSASGYFIHPLPGAVRTQGLHGYNGVDFGAAVGTPIRAAAGGSVIVSRVGGWNGGYGNFVVVEHANGTQTLYAHNSRNAVWQGQIVVQGQVIGYVGNTGRSTGPHLHFEVRGAANPF